MRWTDRPEHDSPENQTRTSGRPGVRPMPSCAYVGKGQPASHITSTDDEQHQHQQ